MIDRWPWVYSVQCREQPAWGAVGVFPLSFSESRLSLIVQDMIKAEDGQYLRASSDGERKEIEGRRRGRSFTFRGRSYDVGEQVRSSIFWFCPGGW